jgi:hypothetical protein
MSHRLLAVLAAIVASLAAAPGAMAGQILFGHNVGREAADIWIMNDDGTNPRPFITRAQIPDATGVTLSDPAVDESTGAVLFNTFIGTGGGINGQAVYLLKDGQITRLSRGGAYGNGGSTSDAEPEPFGNGSFIFRGQACTGETCNVNGFQTQSMSDTAADGNLETRAAWPTACDGSGALDYPAPNPVNPAQVAYSGCIGPNGASERSILVSGPSRQGEKLVSLDDQQAEQVTWRADGGELAAIERSNNAGIFVYNPTDDTPDKRRVVAVESFDSSLSSVTFAGNGELVFEERVGEEKHLRKVSTSCADCAPGSTILLKGGAGEGNFDPEWTPRTSLAGPASTGGGGGGGGGSTGPVAPTPSGVGPDPKVTFARSQKLARKAVALKASCVAACQFTTRGTALKVGKKEYALKTVTKTLGADQTVSVKVKLSKKALAAARKARRSKKKVTVELVMTAYYDGGKKVGGPLIRKVSLK